MPKLLPRHYAKILYELTATLPEKEVDAAALSFLSLLERRRVLKKLPLIIREFTSYAEERSGVKRLTITSAHELSVKTVQKITAAFGDEATATTAVDSVLLGGVVIRTRQAILDASVRTRVHQLATTLVKDLSK